MRRRLARAEHVDGLLRQVAGALRRSQDDRAARVGHEAAVEEVERPRDHARRQDVVDGERVTHDGARVQLRPLAGRDGDLGELLAGRAELVHVARRREGVAGRRPGEPVWKLELRPPRVRAEARARHPTRDAPLACDERHVDDAGVDRRRRVLTWAMNEQPPICVPSM
jgi:hypothetical protein